jgi:hypothetical protein
MNDRIFVAGVVIEDDRAYRPNAPQMAPANGFGYGQPRPTATQERPSTNVTNEHVDEFAFLHASEPLGAPQLSIAYPSFTLGMQIRAKNRASMHAVGMGDRIGGSQPKHSPHSPNPIRVVASAEPVASSAWTPKDACCDGARAAASHSRLPQSPPLPGRATERRRQKMQMQRPRLAHVYPHQALRFACSDDGWQTALAAARHALAGGDARVPSAALL